MHLSTVDLSHWVKHIVHCSACWSYGTTGDVYPAYRDRPWDCTSASWSLCGPRAGTTSQLDWQSHPWDHTRVLMGTGESQSEWFRQVLPGLQEPDPALVFNSHSHFHSWGIQDQAPKALGVRAQGVWGAWEALGWLCPPTIDLINVYCNKVAQIDPTSVVATNLGHLWCDKSYRCLSAWPTSIFTLFHMHPALSFFKVLQAFTFVFLLFQGS